MEKISIVDISKIGLNVTEPSDVDYRTTGDALDLALSQIGFVFLTGHGIKEEVVQDAFNVSKKFFSQPQHIKKQIPILNIQGWVEEGREIFNQAEDGFVAVTEMRESFDINQITDKARFPDESFPNFRSFFTKLAEKEILLSHRLLISVSLALNKPADYLNKCHKKMLKGDNASAVRSLFYPPIVGKLPEGHIRCGEHTDYGTLTLLFQDKYPGLQVKSATGKWVNADPVKGSVLCNIGDLLEMWTAGRYTATLHRVILPEEKSIREEARQSIVFFVHPDYEVIIEPLEGPNPEYPPILAKDHVMRRFAATYKY